MTDHGQLGARLRELRNSRGMSAQKVADACAAAGLPSLDRSKIAKIEADLRRVQDDELTVLAEVLNVPPEWLTTGSGSLDFFVSYTPVDERWAVWIAWQLEAVGHRVTLQAWDFVPGTNFVEFMDRGVSHADAVIIVLSKNYAQSRWGQLEWQAALRLASPDETSNRLVTVRVDDSDPPGLLAAITYIDLSPVPNADEARSLLLTRIRHVQQGRAKPEASPRYPNEVVSAAAGERLGADPPVRRRRPMTPPAFPPDIAELREARSQVCILQLPGPGFRQNGPDRRVEPSAAEAQAMVLAELALCEQGGAPAPDLVVVAGNLTASGGAREFDEALKFLADLRATLSLDADRIIIVPGVADVSRAACRAYFDDCEADGLEPTPPYWRKWRHFHRIFRETYRALDAVVFDGDQPWTLYPVRDLETVVAGVNSTMATSHRPGDDYGLVGTAQTAWFARQLADYRRNGWLRIGVVHHSPLPSAPEPGGLRDAVDFDRLLAPSLNLSITGSPAAPDNLEETSTGNPPESAVLAAPASGALRVVRVTAGGLESWESGPDGSQELPAPSVRRVRWHGVSTTFAVEDDSLAQPSVLSENDITDEPRSDLNPPLRLLARLREVCETKYARPRVRTYQHPRPYLLVTYLDDGYVREARVVAHVGAVDAAVIDEVLSGVHASDPTIESVLVHDGIPVSDAIQARAAACGIRVRSFTEFQGLLDLSGFVQDQTARLRTDSNYAASLYVPQRFRELVGLNREIRNDLVAELLRLVTDEDGRIVLVLGDFGRGKTFAMRELARRVAEGVPSLTPVLVDLRHLDKAHSLDGLVAAHLANHGSTQIDLRAFRYLLRQGRILLIFDGFDELATRVTYERAADHLRTLLDAAQGNAKVVIASRTHHFANDDQVLTALGERVAVAHHRRVFKIEDFTPGQVREYLLNSHGGDAVAAQARMDAIVGVRDLFGLSANPRMLSFVAGLDPERFDAVAQAPHSRSAAALYRDLVGQWIEYEERRTHGIVGAPVGFTVDEMWRAVTTLALRLWQTGEATMAVGDLAEVADVLMELVGGKLDRAETTHALGSGTMLARADDGRFTFIHSSVTEWLVANRIAADLRRPTDTAADVHSGGPGMAAGASLLAQRPLSSLAVDFLCDLAGVEVCQSWAKHVLEVGAGTVPADVGGVLHTNAMAVVRRLQAPITADLRGALLVGEDLSRRKLRNVDLTGADLTDAVLVATDLNGARLNDAVLVGARLDDAELVGADLSGADLRDARLFRTTLDGARTDEATWHRAALVNVSASPATLNVARQAGALIYPDSRFEFAVSPLSVGVTFGFEAGRLPQPVAYNPDGATAVIAMESGEVLVCDARRGLPVRTFQAHASRVHAVAFGDRSLLVTAGADRLVRLWDPLDGQLRRELSGHEGWVWPVEPDPAGGLIAAGDASGVVRVWDAADGQVRHQLRGHATRVWSVAWSPDGTWLATGDDDGVLRAWHIGGDEPLEAEPFFEVHHFAGRVNRVAVSPDGLLVGAADQGGNVLLFDAGTGQRVRGLAGHEHAVYAVAFHPHAPWVATGDTRGTVRLWRTGDDPEQGSDELVTEHTGAVYGLGFSPDGTLLASCDSDGSVRLWDTAARMLRHDLEGHRGSVWPMAFHPTRDQMITVSNDMSARFWDTASGAAWQTVSGHGRRATAISYSADGKLLAGCANDGMVRIWDTRSGERVRVLSAATDRMVSVVCSPDLPLVATTGVGGRIHLWNLSTGEYEREIAVGSDATWAEAFSPDSDVIATANDDDTVRLRYRTTGRPTATISAFRGRVRSIAFHADGALLATGCDDRTVGVWTSDGDQVQVLEGHTDRVYAVAFDRTGDLLLSASFDGTVRLWDWRSGETRNLLHASGRLWTAAFSPDGELLAAAGDDSHVRLWEVRSGRLTAEVRAHSRRVQAVAFSPVGSELASCGDDGATILWDVREPSRPRRRITMLGFSDGWAAFDEGGKYKIEGGGQGQLWHVLGTRRFELGDLDEYVDDVLRVAPGAPLG